MGWRKLNGREKVRGGGERRAKGYTRIGEVTGRRQRKRGNNEKEKNARKRKGLERRNGKQAKLLKECHRKFCTLHQIYWCCIRVTK
jgi:hypothetical protein